jgi:Sulfotransferase family
MKKAGENAGEKAGTLTTDVVFVYGALRSGTTLFRLMLEAHPGMSNPGEADFLVDHLHRDPTHPTGWRYDIAGLAAGRIFQDKKLDLAAGKDGLDLLEDLLNQFAARTPGQAVSLNLHRHLDRLIAAVPRARLIHLIRDPRDVARSSIGMGWAGTLHHGVNHWIDTEAAWDRVAPGLAAGQAFELSYETLFTDVEATLHQVCAFLGLPYDPAMLDYHIATTYGPPDASLINQWKERVPRADLAPMEARAADLMVRRGYMLSGPLEPPVGLGLIRLRLVNRVRIWKFEIKRLGLGLFISEKLTRWLGLSALHRRFAQARRAVTMRHLK